MGFFIGKFGKSIAAFDLPDNIGWFLMALIIPSFFIVIGFHEGGHAIAGILVKFDLRMYVIGPFLWEKESRGWKFKWNKNVNTSGGLVVCLPTGEKNLKNRFAVYAAGGPIASLLLFIIGGAAYFIFKNTSMPMIGYASLLISLFSLIIFIVTIIPSHMGGFASDGARVKKLLQGGDIAEFEILLVKIMTRGTVGIRPRDMSMTELEDALELARKLKSPHEVYVHSMLHQIAFDKGYYDKAELYLKQYMALADNIPEGIRNMVWLDAAFFFAYARKNVSQATEHMNSFKPAALIPKAQIHATEAAISFLNNEKDKGESMKEAAIKELPNMIDRGGAVALRDRLETLS